MAPAKTLFQAYADKHLNTHIRALPDWQRDRVKKALAEVKATSRAERRAPNQEPKQPNSLPQRLWIPSGIIVLVALAFISWRAFLPMARGKESQQAFTPREGLPSNVEKPRVSSTHMAPLRVIGMIDQAEFYAPYGVPYADVVVYRRGYAIGFPQKGGAASWVTYKTVEGKSPGVSNYKVDPDLSQLGIPQLSKDFSRSGFRHGALIPASHLAGIASKEELSYLSLRVMMTETPWSMLNQGSDCLLENKWDQYVIAGPKLGKSSGKNPIPQAFFRICFRISNGIPSEVKAFYLPNNSNISKDSNNYRTSVDEIEAETGLDFFSELEDQSFESQR